MKDHLRRSAIAAAAVAALGLGGTAIAAATGGSDDEETGKPIAGRALDRAGEAALDHLGGGQVSATEAGDEEGAYEVEVTRADGSQVDVHLDEGFNVISQAADGDGGQADGEHESGDEE